MVPAPFEFYVPFGPFDPWRELPASVNSNASCVGNGNPFASFDFFVPFKTEWEQIRS